MPFASSSHITDSKTQCDYVSISLGCSCCYINKRDVILGSVTRLLFRAFGSRNFEL